MSHPRLWTVTTHEWASSIDQEHLARVRSSPQDYGDLRHLVLEVLAYCAEEAQARGSGAARVTVHPDGSVEVADDGRGTDTRTGPSGEPVKKPVMSTRDVRFFDNPEAEVLPDGLPRRGISVVAALSTWLVHTNRRANGSWTQRYEYGVPVTGLEPIDDDGRTGTSVRFLIEDVSPTARFVEDLAASASAWPQLRVEVAAT